MHSLQIHWLFVITLFALTTLLAESKVQAPLGLLDAYQQARQQIETIEEKGKANHWHAVNVSSHQRVDFDGKSVVAHSLKGDWSVSMELTQLGAPKQLKPANKPAVQIVGNRITYDRGNIKEWYINDVKGLEQGFTLDKPLAKEQFVLQFELGGNAKPKLIDQNKVLRLITPQGKKLRYEGLKAWDAKGKKLKTALQLKDKTLQLQVAVVNANYPITIDPWLVE